jgi:cardiolipin synthase
LFEYWPHLTVAGLEVVLLIVVIPWVLLTKRDAKAAVAWCLVVLLWPIFGAFLFWVFGYNYLLHRVRHQRRIHPPHRRQRREPASEQPEDLELGRLAAEVGAFPVSDGNAVTIYDETKQAYDELLEAIAAARHHVHLEYFILRGDETGRRLLDLLTDKAREGVEVRLLFDAMGCLHLKRRVLKPLQEAGGQTIAFLPLNPIRSLIRVNLRNHRKITVVDGRVGFTGGMNIGDEYLGKSPTLGYWRDTFLRLEGPAVGDLQRVFCDDWYFARRRWDDQSLEGDAYFPTVPAAGPYRVQVAESGPDQETNTIREIYYMAIIAARRRLWIASPYLIPDAGLLDALRVARYRGVDLRLLTLRRPDHYISYYAGRYYEAELLGLGVKIYQYDKGMMHSKLMLVDDCWGMVGSANLDNRSLHLNFEVGCVLHTPALVAEVEASFLRDLKSATLLDEQAVADRSRIARVVENACRLMAPNL